ncbi:MAG: rod shape-determining protein MreD [Bacteroidetes bacterium]|nr:rod shape-determining protein MreD [Bacteroidota bacterium]MBK9671198.1 rod shape-determining protein MreD [Bacteroidota bacterium]MBK9798863.1 rod shape-determining protein MreD [Bacteroidota bacterium]MBP6413359.1 rod shape-determining protein MreD [Bacteroidia bacterium]
MINELIKQLFRFAFLLLLQVLVLNNIQFSGYINPYLYVLFILMMPFDTPVWIVLLSGFLMGISVDTFMNTAGMHAAATVAMAFVRSYVLKLFAPREGYEFGTEPTLRYMGPAWYLSYSVLLVSIHHFIFFYIEVFRFNEFFSTLLRVVLSIFFTMILVMLSQFLIYKPRDRK